MEENITLGTNESPNKEYRENNWLFFGIAFAFLILAIGTIFLFINSDRPIEETQDSLVPINIADSDGKVFLKNPRYANGDLDAIFDDVGETNVLRFDLKSHKSVDEIRQVRLDEKADMFYLINSVYQLENALQEPEFIDMKTGKKVDRDYDLVYLADLEENVYDLNCSETNENKTQSCEPIVIGKQAHQEWLPYNSTNIPKGKITIGIDLKIGQDEIIDIIWNVGGKRIDKHAVVTSGATTTFDNSTGQNYTVVTYLNNGTFNTTASLTTEILVVAGGGGGGSSTTGGSMGGGGAGGIIHNGSASLIAGNYSIVVGLGGTGGLAGVDGGNGTNSSFGNSNFKMTAVGGGGGKRNTNGFAGGSGGGTCVETDPNAVGGLTTQNSINGTGYGNNGGTNPGGPCSGSGGGGGAGAVGGDGAGSGDDGTPGNGGNGRQFNITNGTNLYYAGGGGGGSHRQGGGTGGLGGGGAGTQGVETATSGTANTGGGGGGTGNGQAGDGGSGIVIVRYLISDAEAVLNINLISPINNKQFIISNVTFQANVTSTNLTIANVSLLINGTINQTNTSGIIGIYNFSQTFIGGFYNWTVKAFGNNSVQYNASNGTLFFSIVQFVQGNQTFNASVIETSKQTFKTNLTTSVDYTVQNGRLVYNGTIYPFAAKTDFGSGIFSLSQTINIPPGTKGFNSENRSFFWNITLNRISDGTILSQTTDKENQTVNELIFRLCGGTANVAMLNFTMFDEETNQTINATLNPTTFQATFNLGVDFEFKLKNFSIDNQSVNTSRFDFCTNDSSNVFYTDMEAFYKASEYTDKNYYLTNASLSNTTNSISLFLLNATNAIEFFINVEQDLSPLTSATVNIQKFIVGEGVYKTVEIDTTSSDTGEFTAFLDLDKKYRFTITKNGVVQGVVEKTAACKQAPCELTLGLLTASGSFTAFQDAFAQNVVYNLSFNQSNNLVTFDFIDTSGTATYFRMQVYKGAFNESSSLISNQQLFTSAGTMTFNMSNFTEGDFRVEVYISRSPDIFIDFITFNLSQISQVLGILGLFTALIIILTIIFGLSYSPPLLVFSVPLALTLTKLMGIISLSNTSIVLIYVLAVIVAAAMSR